MPARNEDRLGGVFGSRARIDRRRAADEARAAEVSVRLAAEMFNPEAAPKVAVERERMTRLFSQFHLADRQLKAHVKRWSLVGRRYLAPLNAYYDALTVAERPELVPERIRAAGEAAEADCAAANNKHLALLRARHEALTAALVSMGAHHGYAMASDSRGLVGERFVRHIRRMGTTLKAHIPDSRVVGMDDDFPSASGWAKAMGFRSGKALLDVMRMEGVKLTCRRA